MFFNKKSKVMNVNPVQHDLYGLSREAETFNAKILNLPIKFFDSEKKKLAMMALFEMIERLDNRYSSAASLEEILSRASSVDIDVPLSKLQLQYVNRIEAYYQQYYACISALSMAINHVASNETKSGLSIKSNKKFIESLDKKFGHMLGAQLIQLEKARDFRSSFIDHIQQNKIYSWMTYGLPTNDAVIRHCAVIYYFPDFDGSSQTEIDLESENFSPDPYSDNFKLIIPNNGFVVAPNFHICHKAFLNSCFEILNKL